MLLHLVLLKLVLSEQQPAMIATNGTCHLTPTSTPEGGRCRWGNDILNMECQNMCDGLWLDGCRAAQYKDGVEGECILFNAINVRPSYCDSDHTWTPGTASTVQQQVYVGVTTHLPADHECYGIDSPTCQGTASSISSGTVQMCPHS